jgi:hypothetical protein
MRYFGTEISGNRRKSAELSENIRSSIVGAHLLGAKPASLAKDFEVH